MTKKPDDHAAGNASDKRPQAETYEDAVAQGKNDGDSRPQELDHEPARSTHPAVGAGPKIRLGNYRVLQVIGEGGMGQVHLAEQISPIRRRVALKIIKAGLNSKQIIARFEAERQALAIMDHPGIARILDAGTTDEGQPFFAMELVVGEPIVDYCDHHRLSVAQRLELFIDVCEAVQHAHQKGIIHRDLKPSNILVAEMHGRPVAKVIDFGLAKALEATQRLTDKTVFTEFGQIVGTLRYMSPEQASLNPLDIDTRTDIYALGIVLYELLTGSTPLDDNSLRGKTILQLLELVREQDSPRPSSRLSSAGDACLRDITARRQTDSKRLAQVLVGDLDWIVMKTLDKERNRRYESATRLAEDIRRFLNNEAVEARPPSMLYLTKKFVRKNRGPVAALSVIALLLVVGISTTTYLAIVALRAERAALTAARTAQDNEAKAVANRQDALNAIDEFFTTVSEEDLLDAPGMQPLRSKLLRKASSYYENLLTENAAESSRQLVIESRVRYAALLSKLGDNDKAKRLFQEAVDELEDLPTTEENLTMLARLNFHARSELARIASRLGDTEFARQQLDGLQKYLEVSQTKFRQLSLQPLLAETHLAFADLYALRGERSKAAEELVQARDLIRPLMDDSDLEETARYIDIYASALEDLSANSPHDQAVAQLDESIALRRRLLQQHPDRLSNRFALAMSLKDLGWKIYRTDASMALSLFAEADQLSETLLRENPTVVSYRQGCATSLDLHAYALHQTTLKVADAEVRRVGLEEAFTLYARAENILLQPYSTLNFEDAVASLPPSQQTLLAMIFNGKGLVRRDQRHLQPALEEYDKALTIQRTVAKNAPNLVRAQLDVAGTWHNLGRTFAEFHQYVEAADRFRQSVAQFDQAQAKFPDDFTAISPAASSQSELNRMLLYSAEYSVLLRDYRSTVQQWREAIGKYKEPVEDELLRAQLMDDLFTALEGDLANLAARVEPLIQSVRDESSMAFEAALLLAGASRVDPSRDPPPQADLAELSRYARQLVNALLDSHVMSREQLAAEPLLAPLLADQ